MTLPPAMVAGTGELVGPVQKLGGSGAGAGFGADGVVGSAAGAGLGAAGESSSAEKVRADARANISVRARLCAKAGDRIATASSPRRSAVIPRDRVTAPRHLEAVIERRIFAVANDDFHLSLRLRHEAEGDHRIRAHRDVGIEVEYRAALVRRVDGANESRWRVVPRDLVHLHAVEVRMAHHEYRLVGLAGDEVAYQRSFI